MSFANNSFRTLLSSPSSALSQIAAPALSNYSAFQNFVQWAPVVGTQACVESPTPPAEEVVVESPQPGPVPPAPDPTIVVNSDNRERPGITSKTTSVGKKLRLVDHRSFYGFDPAAGSASIPWNRSIDPVRFITGRLWTTYPTLEMVGTTSDLFGKTIQFGHRIPTPDNTAQNPAFIRDIDFNLSALNSSTLEGLYRSILSGGETAPVFSDMAEVGKIIITKGSFRYASEPAAGEDESNVMTFEKFLFGNGPNFTGRETRGAAFASFFENSPLGTSGLFTTIRNQQVASGMYSDHSYEISMPISAVNLEHYGNISKPLSAKIEPVYNYYCKEYELLTSNTQQGPVPEYTLPNIYTLLTEKFSKKLDHQLPQSITNFLRLNYTNNRRGPGEELAEDRIKGFFVDKLNSKGEKVAEESKGMSYFKKWAFSADAMIMDGTFDLFRNNYSRYSMQVFPHEEDRLYLRLKEGKKIFPMLVDIKFSTDRTAPIADAIARTNMDCYLSKFILLPSKNPELRETRRDDRNDDDPTPEFEKDRTGFVESKEFIIKGSSEANTKVVSEMYINTTAHDHAASLTTGRKAYDFEEWIRTIGSTAPTPAVVVFGESKSARLTDFEATPGELQSLPLYQAYLVAKVRNLIKKEGRFRDLSQVYAGKMCYNETLCYKVTKKALVMTADGQPEMQIISTFMIPNKSDTDEVVFTDTQVRYDSPYFYQIDAVNLVIGNEYFFAFPHNIPGNRQIQIDNLVGANTCELHYCNYPSIKIIETPYYNSHEKEDVAPTRVIDSPPVPPMVTVNPYKGIADRLLICANGGVGDFVDHPVAINDEDGEIIEKIRQAQMVELASMEKNDITVEKLQKVRFKSDDIIRMFEIYRTTSRPISYADFSGKLHATLDTAEKVNSLSLVDGVTPNVKYYYTFRAIDVHGYFSNPTLVYEVEMRLNEGLAYPIIRTFHPGEVSTDKIPTRPFQKFLEIRPHEDHLLLDYEASGLDGEKNVAQAEGSGRMISSLFPVREEDFKNSENPESPGSQFKLGQTDSKDSPWGRRFKIRITSRHSGRKIDLNVKFDYKDLVKASDFYSKDREN